MDDFYSTILKALLKDGILTREMRILVVCGAVPDKDALRREGFANVTISSLDERYDKQEFAPYVWSFQDAEKLSFDLE